LFAVLRLLPVAFDQNVLAMAVNPVVGNPPLPPLGRPIVAAGRPHIVVAVVAMIAGLPYVSLARRRAALFVHWCGWPDADYDLRKRRRRDQSKSEQECHCDFLHENRVLQGWMLLDLRAVSGMLRK
jgi:hypothetical protein